jgi:beta-lactamase superfamily II metal-dependent hydrolase
MPTGKKKKPKAPNGREVTVRMYNVGFGDAFLVTIPDGASARRILFDCGSIEAAEFAMPDVVERIIKDVTDTDNVPRIDVVVASHRHKDHVSGFGQSAWNDVQVKEVWMPWTEHPTDPEARRIRDIQSRLALGLHARLAAAAATDPVARRYRDIVANALMLSNEKSMKTLHSGFLGQPQRRFLPELPAGASATVRTFESPALPDVRVHVMGPSREREVIRDMDPPSGESFLRLQGVSLGPADQVPSPFSAEFVLPDYTGTASLHPDDLNEVQRAGNLTDLAVAVALDKAVNGTSLMLMLEISGTHFLFPGDAQWGTWNAAMADDEWKELLRRVAFYKIGHHGSHNATPKSFVDTLLPDGVCAMASTLTRDIWPDIPRSELLTGLLAKKALVARSDQESKAGNTFRKDNGVIEARIPL